VRRSSQSSAAKARARLQKSNGNDQVLEDIFVSGRHSNTADIDNRNIADGRFFTDIEADGCARGLYRRGHRHQTFSGR